MLADVVGADLLPEGTTLLCAGYSEIAAIACGDGRVSFGGETCDTLSNSAAAGSTGASPNQWTYWVADLADGHFSLSSLGEAFLSSRDQS